MDVLDTTPPYLLHPSSAAFLAGDPLEARQRFETRRDALDYLLVAGLVVAALFTLITLVQMGMDLSNGRDLSGRSAALVLGTLMLVAGGFLQASRVRANRTRLRLVPEGRVVEGVVVAWRDEPFEMTESEAGEPVQMYRVEIDYSFTSPSGQELLDHDEAVKSDLADRPQAGAPVRVLYLDDGHYALL